MDRVKWGILGAANIAYDQVVPAIRRSGMGDVIAVASKSKEKAKRFHVSNVYDSYEELLRDDQVDAVYIPLPNALHKEWAVKAMSAQKHVLVEKPATISEDDMQEMCEAAQQNHVIFMEAFMYQFHSQHQYVKELMGSGVIGDYRYVKAHFSFFLEDREDIRFNRELGGGALWDVGCYGIHAVTQIVGMQPTHISMIGKVDPEHQVDTTSVCFLQDDSNRCAEVSASFEGSFIDRYEIFGEKGAIIVESAFRPDVSKDGSGIVKLLDLNGHEIQRKSFEDDQYVKQVNHFQECVIHNKTPIYNESDSLKIVKYLESAYKSMRNASKEIEI